MKVCELMVSLMDLEPDALINMSSNEEGNIYRDIAHDFAEGQLSNGSKVYSLNPTNEKYFVLELNCENPL